MAADEVGAADQVRGANRRGAETQVRHGHRTGLLRVVNEVALRVVIGVFADDLDGVLVGADGAVGPEAVEQAADHAVRLDGELGIVVDAGVRDVVIDPNREVILRPLSEEMVEQAFDHRRREFLRRQPVATADQRGKRHEPAPAVADAFVDRVDAVKVQRLACAARFLGSVEHREGLGGGGKCFDETTHIERAVQSHLQHADLLPARVECVDRFVHRLSARTHQDDDALGVRCAVILVETVRAADERGELHPLPSA